MSIAVATAVPPALVLGVTQAQALLLLFVILPVVAGVVLVAVVGWRPSSGPGPVRTSTILAEGHPADAEVLSVKSLGGALDLRPMVRIRLRVRGEPGQPPFDLEVVQSLPRGAIREIHAGDVVEVRLSTDRSAGAVVWGGPTGPE